MYVSNSFKKYDGYKALKILEVILILNIQKDYCSGFTKNIRCINCLLKMYLLSLCRVAFILPLIFLLYDLYHNFLILK